MLSHTIHDHYACVIVCSALGHSCVYTLLNCTFTFPNLSCSVKFSHDSRLRNAAVDVYSALYGRLTPTCMPQGVGILSLRPQDHFMLYTYFQFQYLYMHIHKVLRLSSPVFSLACICTCICMLLFYCFTAKVYR